MGQYYASVDNIFGPESMSVQVRWISAWARGLSRPLLFTGGNHDVESKEAPVSSGRWMAALPGAKDFSKSGHVERLGHTFVRIGWMMKPIPELRRDDIILAHAPPDGCFTAGSRGAGTDGDLDLGDALRSAVAAPWLVLSGHCHSPERWVDRCGGTFTLNPGVGRNPEVPNYITVDSATRKARWFTNGELADVASL